MAETKPEVYKNKMYKRRRVMHVNTHAILVGYCGKFGWDDRLLPLRMSRKYKKVLEQEELNRNEKVLQMSQLIQKYQNLSSIINNLKKENKNNENSRLLVELQGEKTRCKKCLLFMESELDQYPDILNTSMQEIFNREFDTKQSNKNHSLHTPKWKRRACRKKSYANKECVWTGQNSKQSSSYPMPRKEPNESFGTTSSCMYGSVKSQILVKDNFSNLHTISIDLFSNGENLSQVIATEFGEEVEKCNITFGTKKVEKEKSLYEQEIYHGSTVNFSLKLHGGTKGKKRHKKKMNMPVNRDDPSINSLTTEGSPESWTKAQVKDWFVNICKDSEFDEVVISKFASMNGTALNKLPKEQWLSRSPDLGDVLFDLWNGLKNEQPNEGSSETDTKKERKSGSPESWTKAQVKDWFVNICKDYELDEVVISKFVSMNGKLLNKLPKEQWLSRSPDLGDVLFDLWNGLKNEQPNEESSGTDTKKERKSELSTMVPMASEKLKYLDLLKRQKICQELNLPRPLGGDYKTLAALIGMTNDKLRHIERKSHDNPAEEVLRWWETQSSATVPNLRKHFLHRDMNRDDLIAILDNCSSPDSNSLPTSAATLEKKTSIHDSITRGPFGKVDNLKDVGDSISLYKLVADGESVTLKPGTIISVSGICRKKPERQGELVTFLLRDAPPGAASSFNQVKIDLQTSHNLIRETVEDILKKIDPGTPVAVRGRVEKLDDGYVSKEQSYETLGFKLVVDTDIHALVYEVKRTCTLSRQRSQPWYIEMGIYPCVVDDKSLDVGGIIKKTNDRIFCNIAAPDGEIKRNSIAFKNSFGGDIFVGVEGDGKVTGMEFTQEELVKWKEKISMIIGQILPESKEQMSICASEEDARENTGKKSFVSVMKLGDSAVRGLEKVRVIARIHVTRGTDGVYFSKQSDIHAYVRVDAETKRITDYPDLFSRLDSLRTRTIQPIVDEDSFIEQQCNETMKQKNDKYNIFKELKYENQEHEFIMIFGDKPVGKIENKYLAQFTCAFLNSSGGSILFGVQEDERSNKQSKIGYVVGILIPPKEREELVKKSISVLSNIYPPVSYSSQFLVTFYDVNVGPELLIKYPKTSGNKSGKCVLLRGPADEIDTNWQTFIKDKLPAGTYCRVIRVESKCFCIVSNEPKSIPKTFMKIVNLFAEKNVNVSLDDVEEKDLKLVLKNVCIVELLVYRSPYPIHMTKPIETFVIDEHGERSSLSQDKLMHKFEMDSRSVFDVEKFLGHVKNFTPAGNSYFLIASSFDLPKLERDLYGLVIPEWTLAIDFDRDLKQEGHLYHIFADLNDLHQTERNHFVRTPHDHKLDLNPDHGVCWLAARGYKEIAASLSKEDHGMWNMTHRAALKSHLEVEITRCVKPNQLNIVVLWDEKQRKAVNSLRTILEDILSINGERTTVTFVCSTPEAKSDISDNLVKPLQDNYKEIIEEDRVYEAPPEVLAKHLSCKLAAPYRSEDNYQVPHKRNCRGEVQILPATLPQRLRQNIHGHLKMMYITRERKAIETKLKKERKEFYSGSEITEVGLRSEIGVKRCKMAVLEKEFNILLRDKKSHVSLILVKADRGAGTTTMCLQFLFQYHKKYPCAQLVEIKDGLVSYIESINKETKLPLILLVDQEINLQDFSDLKKEVERARGANVIFLVIEPAEVFCRKRPTSPHRTSNPRIKSVSDDLLNETSHHKVVELKRELEETEMEALTDELIAIADNSKSTPLTKLKETCKHQKALRTFAHFSLTAFGREFSGLSEYVKFRLEFADEKQKTVLAFLALTHVFAAYFFPASALAGFLKKRQVVWEGEFRNSYLRELLSPPVDENDSRRISFHEVAEEILTQLALETPCANNQDQYWSYIKHISVQMATVVLRDNIGTKKIDRLSRKLFVTSEYESEKFSLLIRSMKDDNADTARDTLIELVMVFQQHTSFRAHLLAHLAKYYMTVYKDFAEAKPLIVQAVTDQKDDILLHHIHGDIIRLHVQALKQNPENVDLNEIVSCAIESSGIFEFVRRKRPHMSHGYVSDAMVRITVMQAARKTVKVKDANFVDYLIRMIDNLKEKKEKISKNERYLLSLIPDAHQYLTDSAIDVGHKERWKDNFMKCIGKLCNLKRLYEKLRDEKDYFRDCSGWLQEISLETQVLYNALVIETEDLSPEELERMIKEIEECGSRSQISERAMRFWIQYSRLSKSVPTLEDVSKRIKQWIAKGKKREGVSPHAEFYKYVVNVLIALKDPNDREKMAVAEKRPKGKKYNKKEEVLPLEWLHCKEGHHIKSVDSLLGHDDLVKKASKFSRDQGKRKPGREVIEGSLFEKQVTKWEGIVKEIRNCWHGTIVFKDYLEVRFVPMNVQPSMPSTGETVRFCLGFDWHGLSAWFVARAVEYQPKRLSEFVSSDEDTSNENDQKDTEYEIAVPPSLHLVDIPEERREIWEDYSGKRMQGVVISTNPQKGFGFLRHPDVTDKLFFHASQLVSPVMSLEGTIITYMTLEFVVQNFDGRTRAADISVLKNEDTSRTFQEFVVRLQEEHRLAASSSRSENKSSIPVGSGETRGPEEGLIKRLHESNAYGFIKPDNISHGLTEIFFHRNNLVNKETQFKIGDRVQFRVSETEKGLEANDIFVQVDDNAPPIQDSSARLRVGQLSAASSRRCENKYSIPVKRGETRGQEEQEEGVIIKLCKDNTYGFIKPDNNLHGTTEIFFHRNNLVNKETELRVRDRLQFRVSETEKGLEANDVSVKVDDNAPAIQDSSACLRVGQLSAASSRRCENKSSIPVKRGETRGQEEQEEGVIIKLFQDNTYGFIKPDNNLHGTTEIFIHRKNLVNKETELRVRDRVKFRVSETEKGLEANDISVKVDDNAPAIQDSSACLRVIPVKRGETRGQEEQEEGVIKTLCKDNTYGFIKPDNNLHGTIEVFFHRNNLVNKEAKLRVGDRLQFRVSETEKGLEANDVSVKVDDNAPAIQDSSACLRVGQHSAASSRRCENKSSIPVKREETRGQEEQEEGVIIKWFKDSSYGFIKPDNYLHGTTGIFFHRNYFVNKETEIRVGDRVKFCVSETKKGLEANYISVKIHAEKEILERTRIGPSFKYKPLSSSSPRLGNQPDDADRLDKES